MDLSNNWEGCKIGESNQEASDEQLAELVMRALVLGRLQTEPEKKDIQELPYEDLHNEKMVVIQSLISRNSYLLLAGVITFIYITINGCSLDEGQNNIFIDRDIYEIVAPDTLLMIGQSMSVINRYYNIKIENDYVPPSIMLNNNPNFEKVYLFSENKKIRSLHFIPRNTIHVKKFDKDSAKIFIDKCCSLFGNDYSINKVEGAKKTTPLNSNRERYNISWVLHNKIIFHLQVESLLKDNKVYDVFKIHVLTLSKDISNKQQLRSDSLRNQIINIKRAYLNKQ